MGIDDLAARLADRTRIGLTPELADKLRVLPAENFRAKLLAMSDENNSPLGVYILGVYVVDDTDFWSDGEIYWWTIPVIVDVDGKTGWSASSGLPMGAAPHSVGSLDWMTNFSLKDPPMIACIPPDEPKACVIRVAFYDDDGALADVPKAMSAAYQALSACKSTGLPSPDQIITPVREAIWTSLRAEQDDILIDEDLTLRRGERSNFNAGYIGSMINSMVRIYYLIRDEQRTEQFGPIALHKGQTETVQFKTPLQPGGRVALFARGADVKAAAFGDLTTEQPFVDRALDDRSATVLNQQGITVLGSGPAKFVAYYTPPSPSTPAPQS